MPATRQAAVTIAAGPPAERLGRTFASFGQNSFLKLHAFIIDRWLPKTHEAGIHYRQVDPDPTYNGAMCELHYRRLLLIDELDYEYVVLVDNSDVLCLQPIPELPVLLRGAAVGACIEYVGGQYIEGQGYTSSFLNAGVTFWNVPNSRPIRAAIVEHGLSRHRGVEHQVAFNEVVQTRFYEDLIILPCQYNYRPCLAPKRVRGWPTVRHLDGVRIYHNKHCIEAAKRLARIAPMATLPDLKPDRGSLTPTRKFLRKVQHRLFYRHSASMRFR